MEEESKESLQQQRNILVLKLGVKFMGVYFIFMLSNLHAQFIHTSFVSNAKEYIFSKDY